MDEIELLARMWIACDPNRYIDADEIAMLWVDGVQTRQPRWKWFIPRAEATIKFLAANGREIAMIQDPPSETA